MARIKPKALLIQSKAKKGPSRIGLCTIITANLIIVLIVLSLYATYKHWHHGSINDVHTERLNIEHAEASGNVNKPIQPTYAVLETGKGSITIELNKEAAPDIVDKFIDLCKKGYFKGMLFHHVIKNYMIEGGELDKQKASQDWILRAKANGLDIMSPKHEAFMVGTSKVNPSGKGFDLLITTAPIPDLNDKLVIFGRVAKGEDVVQEIEEVDTDDHYQPKSDIRITNITLKQEM